MKRRICYGLLLAVLLSLWGTHSALAYQANAFVTRWRGSTAEDSKLRVMGADGKLTYYKVTSGTINKVGDEVSLNISDGKKFTTINFKTEAGQEYLVEITGPKVYAFQVGTPNDFVEVLQWGNIKWQSLSEAFKNCAKLKNLPDAAPDLSACGSLSGMFQGCTELVTIHATKWNDAVSNVNHFGSMFSGCQLFNDNVSGWNVENILSMNSMFANCGKFNQNLAAWGPKLKRVRSMVSVFQSCIAFEGAGLEDWNVSNVENFSYMFINCSALTMKPEKWDVSKAQSLASMFSGCSYFEGQLDKWNVKNVTDFSYMFSNCGRFQGKVDEWLVGENSATDLTAMFRGCGKFNGDIRRWNVSKVTNMSYLFSQCVQFAQNIFEWDVAQVTDMSYCFDGCVNFTHDLQSWDVSNVLSMRGMFRGAKNYNRSFEAWKDRVSNVTDFSEMFQGCSDFTGSGLNGWNVARGENFAWMFSGCYAFNGIITRWNMGKAKSTKRMFNECTVFNADISSWRPLRVEDASGMFANAKAFHRDLKDWRMPRLIDMSFMFAWCDEFDCELKDWDVAQVRNFEQTFVNCFKFKSDLSSWDVSNGENFAGMFRYARSFTSDLSRWNVSLATDMKQMFYEASKFTSDLSRWNVSKVTDMSEMFYRAKFFNSDISQWKVSRVTDMSGIFEEAAAFNCPLGSWDISGLTNKNISLSNCGMGVANYERTLLGWLHLDGVPHGIQLTADALRYRKDSEAATARKTLHDTKAWNITLDSESDGPSFRKLELTPTMTTINLGEEHEVTYKITPHEDNPVLNWTSTNENVAAYDSNTGKVKGKKVGSAIIRCQVGSDNSERAYDELFVNVVILVEKLEFKQPKYDNLPVGETFDFAKELTITPPNATNKRLHWESSRPDIISIDENTGLATTFIKNPAAIGEAVISVWATDQEKTHAAKAEVPVKVVEIDATSIVADPQEVNAKPGSRLQLGVLFTPANTTHRQVTWSSPDANLIEVLDAAKGLILVKDKESDPEYGGFAVDLTVKHTTPHGTLEATCRVNVLVKNLTFPEKLTVSPEVLEMDIHEEKQITATLVPSHVFNTDLVWATKNSKVATVKDGKVTGVGKGETIITVWSVVDRNVFAQTKVKVNEVLVSDIIFDKTVANYVASDDLYEIPEGVETTIPYRLEPSNASNREVKWESENTEWVSVDEHTGRLKGLPAGKSKVVTIKATALGGSNIYRECKVRVVELLTPRSISIQQDLFVMPDIRGQFDVIYDPEEVTDRLVTWESSDPNIFAVYSDGSYWAREAGNVKVTVTLVSDPRKQAKCNVKVLPRLATQSLSIVKELSLGLGAEYKYTPEILPVNATDRDLVWTLVAGKKNITLDAHTGIIKGIALGSARISVALKSNPTIKATSDIVVVNKKPLTSDIKFKEESYEVEEGHSLDLEIEYTPADANDLTLEFKSENETYVMVVNSPASYAAARIHGRLFSDNQWITITGTNLATQKTFTTKVKVLAPKGSEIPAPSEFSTVLPSLTILEGNTGYIELKDLKPKNSDPRKLDWRSENETVATVSPTGSVFGKKAGQSTITISGNGHSATIVVYVVKQGANPGPTPQPNPDPNNPNNPDPNKPALENFFAPENTPVGVVVGSKTYIHLKTQPEGANTGNLTWTSEDPAIAEVKNGVLTGIAVGDTKVTVSDDNGKSVTFDVKVFERPATEDPNKPSLIDFEAPEKLPVTIELGGKTKVKLRVIPENADISRLKWESGDQTKVTVDENGVCSGLAVGETTLKVSDPISGRSVTFAVEVKAANNPNNPDPSKPALEELLGVENDPVGVVVGGFTYVHLKTKPEGADTSGLTWESENTSIADVKNGVLMGIAKGETKVKVTDKNGNAITFNVNVVERPSTEDPNKPSLIDFDVPAKLPVGVVLGGKTKIRLKVTPIGADISRLKWEAADETKVTVDENGVMSGLALGKTTIKVSDPVSGRSIEFEAEVVENTGDPTKPIMNDFDKKDDKPVKVKVGQEATLPIVTDPEGADKSRLEYESSDPSIVTVDKDGKIKGVKPGNAKVKVTDPVSGKTIEFDIRVVEKTTDPSKPSLESFSVVRSALYVVKNFDAIVPLNVEPENADVSGLVWSTQDAGIAAVSESGVITGVALGQTVVTVVNPATAVSYAINVTVIAEETTAVEEKLLADVTAVPNPFATQLTVRGYKSENGRYELTSLGGVTLRAGSLWSGETQIETTDLPTGLYLLRLTTATGETKTLKVVKR